jgi:hypothetical protein
MGTQPQGLFPPRAILGARVRVATAGAPRGMALDQDEVANVAVAISIKTTIIHIVAATRRH